MHLSETIGQVITEQMSQLLPVAGPTASESGVFGEEVTEHMSQPLPFAGSTAQESGVPHSSREEILEEP